MHIKIHMYTLQNSFKKNKGKAISITSIFRSSGGMTLCLHDRVSVSLSVCHHFGILFYILVYTFLSVYIFLIQQLITFIFGMHVP